MALVFSLLVMAGILVMIGSALTVGSADILATRNYRGAMQVHLVAESAIVQAVQTANGPGVMSFQDDVVAQWEATFGSAPRPFAPLPGFEYSVRPIANAGDPANTGTYVATATGPEGVLNRVVATVERFAAPLSSPGAIYLATDAATDATLRGNAFAVDGNDHNYSGGFGPADPILGIATRNDANAQEARQSLNAQQADNIQGVGFANGSPPVPSIAASPVAMTVAQMNEFIANLLELDDIVTIGSDSVHGGDTFGTAASPQITHFTAGETTVKGNGNVSGAGIMIVDGGLTIQGNLDFKGLILVRGQTTVTGNATVYGAIWTQDVNLTVGGSAIVYYSSQALALADQVDGDGASPAPLRVTALADCAQLPAGASGCP
jgi:hypothetical protein